MLHKASFQNFWPIVQKDFKSTLPSDVYQTWFSSLDCLMEKEDSIVLGVPNEFAAIWIQDNYIDLISERINMAAGRRLNLSIEVIPSNGQKAGAVVSESSSPNNRLNGSTPKSDLNGETVVQDQSSKQTSSAAYFSLNPKNTFENFIIGDGNQLAHAASVAIANAPARAYNPLFLYGETGLGKTHLMHAVAHSILRDNAGAKVAYISSEKFTNEFIHAIQENTLVRFRRRYRNVDILLIDDIHFLAGKERIQEEFFHTFNDLFESGRQIFLTSDRPASEIAKLENRLISRFQWGLVSDIQPPDLETRLAILGKKAAALNADLSEEILEFLAERISRNVRRMEGALTRIVSYASFVKQELNIPVVEKLLQDIFLEEAQHQITIEKIQQKVVNYYRIQLADLVSKRRTASIVFPRQVAMHLSRVLTTHSLQDIGKAFGGRDHGTVIHACKAVENMMDQEASVKRSVDSLIQQLSQNQN